MMIFSKKLQELLQVKYLEEPGSGWTHLNGIFFGKPLEHVSETLQLLANLMANEVLQWWRAQKCALDHILQKLLSLFYCSESSNALTVGHKATGKAWVLLKKESSAAFLNTCGSHWFIKQGLHLRSLRTFAISILSHSADWLPLS